MTKLNEFGLSLDSTQMLKKMQEQSNDWIKTTTELANCRDLAAVVKLQSDFSKRMMERWFSGFTPPVPAKRAAPSKAAASQSGIKLNVSAAPVAPVKPEPAKPAAKKPAPAKAAKADDMAVVTAIKDHKPATPAKSSKAAAADDLTALKGIGPAMARRLEHLGIKSLQDVANMTPEKIAEVEAAIGFKGRVTRDDWLGQAKSLLG